MMRTSPRFAPLQPRAVRRVLVLAAYLGYVALLLVWTLLPRPWNLVAALVVGLMTVTAGGGLLAPHALGLSDGPDALLDERQQRVRNEAYVNAYRALGTLVILAALYVMIGHDAGWWLPRTSSALQATFWGVLLLAVTLPVAILAWSEPDDQP